MNSSTSRNNAIKLTQDQLKQQIAELQARLLPEPAPDTTAPAPKSPKRKALEPITLAPATPSPSEQSYTLL
jgi:minichromosome maintenance protein 10